MLQKAWNWIVLSSTNAANYSLTIKGFSTFVPSIVIFLGLLHITVAGGTISSAIDDLALTVTTLGSVIGGIVTVVGLVRKIIRSLQGQNAVTNTVNAQL